MIRWLTMSMRPPKYPLANPQSAPSVVPNSTAPTATVSDARLPWSTRLNTSLPIWSVPK